jgi:Caudovirus prohead serine protease
MSRKPRSGGVFAVLATILGLFGWTRSGHGRALVMDPSDAGPAPDLIALAVREHHLGKSELAKDVDVLLDWHIEEAFPGPADFPDSDDLRGVASGSEDGQGASYEVELFDGIAALLLAALREGRYGSSFRARVVKESFDPRPGRSEHNPQGLPERIVKEVKLIDVGPTSLPAYGETTAKVRSLDLGTLKPRSLEFVGEQPDWFLERDKPVWLLERST